jgi:hypothetical protein
MTVTMLHRATPAAQHSTRRVQGTTLRSRTVARYLPAPTMPDLHAQELARAQMLRLCVAFLENGSVGLTTVHHFAQLVRYSDAIMGGFVRH